jgi:alpha-ribazole phosphatase
VHIYLIRHPQPADTQHLCYGRKDVFVGGQARATAEALVRARISAPLAAGAAIFSSPLSRCRMLAGPLASPGLPTIADDLTEIDFGLWEGRPWDAVPRGELDAWAADVWKYRPGGGESADMGASRWRRWSASVRDLSASSVVAVTHAGFIRVALACEGLLSAAEVAANAIGFGSVHCLELKDSEVQACAR